MTIGSPVRATLNRTSGRAHVRAGIIIVVCALTNMVIATRGSLYADDFRGSTMASVDPWSWDWLVGWQTSRHFAPFQRAHYSLFVDVAPLNHGFAVAVVGVELIVAMALFWLLVRHIFGDKWSLVVLVIAGLNPLFTATFAWLVQAVALVGLLMGLHAAALALVNYIRAPRVRWLLLAGFGWMLAALSWESWLVGPPALFLLVLIWQPRGRIESMLLGAWRAAPGFWITSGAVVVGYLTIWKLGGYGTGAQWPSVSDALTTIWNSLYLMVVPGFAGGPWTWYAAGNTFSPLAAPALPRVAALAVAATVLFMTAYRRDRDLAMRGLLVCLLIPAAAISLPVLGRGVQFPGLVEIEPRYVAWAIPIASAGLVLLVQGLQPRTWSVWQRRAAAAVVAAVVLGLLTTDSRFIRIWSANPSGEYVSNAKKALAESPAGSGIFNTEVPADVLSRWAFLGLNNNRELLRPVLRDQVDRFGAANSAQMFDESGQLIDAQFYPLVWAPLAACRYIPEGEPIQIDLTKEQIHLTGLTLRIASTALAAGSLDYVINDSDESNEPTTTPKWGPGELPVTFGTVEVGPGANDQYLLLPPMTIRSVTLTAAGTPVCIDSLVVGQPAP